jgi:hypothetical protein
MARSVPIREIARKPLYINYLHWMWMCGVRGGKTCDFRTLEEELWTEIQ